MAAAGIGIYGAMAELAFSSKLNPVVGELAIAHGDWQFENGFMTHSTKGKLPKQAEREIERLLKDAALPNDSVKIEYDSKSKITNFKITDELFPMVQQHIRDKITLRQEALNIIKDETRAGYKTNERGQNIIDYLSVKGLDKKHITAIQNMLKYDFDIETNVIYKEHKTVLDIDQTDHEKFMDICGHDQTSHIDKIRITNKAEETYAPGFVDTLLHPSKHPKQHGILIGGLGGSLVQIVAGLQDEKMKHGRMAKSPWESANAAWGLMTHLIDYMPEAKNKTNKIITSTNLNSSSLDKLFNDTTEKLDGRPLLTGAIFKAPALAMKFVDATAALDKGDPYKMIGTVLSTIRAAINTTLQKSDYGID